MCARWAPILTERAFVKNCAQKEECRSYLSALTTRTTRNKKSYTRCRDDNVSVPQHSMHQVLTTEL